MQLINLEPLPVIWLFILTVLIIWMILNLILGNSLVKIKGTNVTENKRHMITTLDNFYNGLIFQTNNEKLMRSFKPSYKPICGRVVTVIFESSSMYLNITKLGKSDSPTLIHGLLNYLKAKRIAKYFETHYGN